MSGLASSPPGIRRWPADWKSTSIGIDSGCGDSWRITTNSVETIGKPFLRHRFPGVDAKLLYDAWESTSEIIPQLNRSSWSPTDAAFSAEGCMQRAGFLTVDDYYFDRDPMPLSRIDNAS